jgi:hypothetical protein
MARWANLLGLCFLHRPHRLLLHVVLVYRVHLLTDMPRLCKHLVVRRVCRQEQVSLTVATNWFGLERTLTTPSSLVKALVSGFFPRFSISI